MINHGYIYVLANSAMPGLIKVGKTKRNPILRAQELSGVTSTPTPFIVVYQQLFEDCNAAEVYIHSMLEKRGVRESDSREFFRSSPNDIIEIILATPGKASCEVQANTESGSNDLLIQDERILLGLAGEDGIFPWAGCPWEGVWEEANNYYFGLGDTIQDYEEAMQLYIQAAKLGCLMAYDNIGSMWRDGVGVQKSSSKALDYFKIGAKAGNYYCHYSMALLFMKNDNPENEYKCMMKFFRSRKEKLNKGLEKEYSIVYYCLNYIRACIRYKYNPSREVCSEMSEYKNSIVEYANDQISHYEGKGLDVMLWEYKAVLKFSVEIL
ncbi:MAG: GIY-YIG nuclease family protein [Desulfobacteria bacterium]